MNSNNIGTRRNEWCKIHQKQISDRVSQYLQGEADNGQLFFWDIKIPVHKQNFRFILWIFDKGKPLKAARLLAPRIVENMDYDNHRVGNKKRRLNEKKMCKGELCAVSVDNGNCPILEAKIGLRGYVQCEIQVVIFILLRIIQKVPRPGGGHSQ